MCGGAMVDAPVPAPPAPRRPVAGWALTEAGALRLHAIGPDALAWFAEGTWNWCILGTAAMGQAPTLEAAQLAAEDTLRAVLVDAAAALGLRVVPS